MSPVTVRHAWWQPVKLRRKSSESLKRDTAETWECGLARSTRKVVGVELAYPKMRRELMIAAVRELGDVRGLGLRVQR